VSWYSKTKFDEKPASPDCLGWTGEFLHTAAAHRGIGLREREKLRAIAVMKVVQNDGTVTI
jgi:hypothetical protein